MRIKQTEISQHRLDSLCKLSFQSLHRSGMQGIANSTWPVVWFIPLLYHITEQIQFAVCELNSIHPPVIYIRLSLHNEHRFIEVHPLRMSLPVQRFTRI